MKILAPFDRSPASEAALDQISKIAVSARDEVVLFSVIEPPEGGIRMRGPLRPIVAVAPLQGAGAVVVNRAAPATVENKGQAIERQIAERTDYLRDLSTRLPEGPRYSFEAVMHDDPACAIIERALVLQPDVIVMATHGHSGLVHILFGDVAEEVVRSGVAPVLLVHPETVKDARRSSRR
jgi:nucleotide-binding universal stress UspA family protein